MPQVAELDKQTLDSRHLFFRFIPNDALLSTTLQSARFFREKGYDVFIWDGKVLPINPRDPRTRDIINCANCFEDIQIQNRKLKIK